MGTTTRTRHAHRAGLVAVPVVAGLLGVAAAAFACVPQASIKVAPTSGAAGTTVTVTGSSFQGGASVRVHWGGISGQQVAATTASPTGTINTTFVVPSTAPNGQTIVSVNQVDASGVAIGGPANTLFNVTTPGAAAPQPAPVLQEEQMANSDGAAGLAPVDASLPAAAAAPTPAPAATDARPAVVPTRSTTAGAPATTAVPAPAAPAPVPAPAAEAAPAPSVAAAPPPEVAADPAPAPARRPTMVTMAGADGSSPALAIALVAVGLLLALGASAVALASRRSDTAAPRPTTR